MRPLLIPHSLVFNNPNFLCFFSHREKAAEEKLILVDNFFLLILLRITHPWYITGGGLYTMHVIQPFICKMRQTARYLHKWKDDASLRKKKNIPRRGYAVRNKAVIVVELMRVGALPRTGYFSVLGKINSLSAHLPGCTSDHLDSIWDRKLEERSHSESVSKSVKIVGSHILVTIVFWLN